MLLTFWFPAFLFRRVHLRGISGRRRPSIRSSPAAHAIQRQTPPPRLPAYSHEVRLPLKPELMTILFSIVNSFVLYSGLSRTPDLTAERGRFPSVRFAAGSGKIARVLPAAIQAVALHCCVSCESGTAASGVGKKAKVTESCRLRATR